MSRTQNGIMFCALIVWISCLGIVSGISINVEPDKPALGNSMTVTCQRSSSSNASISWDVDSSVITTCDGSTNNICIPSPTGYTYSTDVLANEFNLTRATILITDCKTYACTDTVTNTDTISKNIQLAYYSKSDISPTEPGANTNGSISITTGCVLSPDDLTITWTKIVNGNSVALSSDDPSPVSSTDRSNCTRTCHTEEDKKATSRFTHTEYAGTDSETYQYMVTVSHSWYPDNADVYTWTSANYTQKKATTGDDDNGLSTGDIVGIVIGSVVFVIIIAIMGKLQAPPEALIRYCVIIMDDIPTWLLGASIGAFWVVTEVLPGGPADGKLEVGYKIYEINDKAVTEENHNKIEEMINDKEILTLRVSKVGIPDTSYVQLKCKKGELLGFEVEHLPMVTEVSDGSKADGKLEKGDRILSINGKSTTGKSIGDINKQLKIPPKVLDLSLKRGEDKKHVTLDFKGKASSGIAIKKETEDIVVSTIEPESAAAISGEIQEKDIILSVNGVSTTGMKDADIIEMLKFSIILKVTKDVTLKELDPDHNGSFGVETFPTNSTRGPANMVDTVTHDGPAQRHGIKHGDTIVSINGKNTKGKSHQEIEAMLKTFGTSISLEIKKGDTGGPVAIE